LIEIKDAKGVVLFSSAAYWGDKDKGLGIAQIKGLIGLPAVNFYAEYALGPDPLQEPVEWRPRSTRAANFELLATNARCPCGLSASLTTVSRNGSPAFGFPAPMGSASLWQAQRWRRADGP